MSSQERKKNPSAFLRNIFQILQNTELNSVIEWAPQGNGFIIKDLPKFQVNILPQYFKHKKYSSFVRQLNMYGFHKQRNSNFENCFLHQQFRRGNQRLPTDIKRKPQKKKKTTDQDLPSQGTDGNNWFTFSQELREHFPHIAENILVRNIAENILLRRNEENENNILLNQGKNESEQFQSSSKMMEQSDGSESEEYVSRINFKGLMENLQEHSSAHKRQQWQKMISEKMDFDRVEHSYENNEINQSIRERGESQINESSDKKFQKHKQDTKIQTKSLNANFDQHNECMHKGVQLSSICFSMLQNTLQSLSGLSEVLVRQNEILLKTHPIIRNVVLKSQQNKIGYLNQQIQSFQNSQNNQNLIQWHENKSIQNLLQNEKQEIINLTDLLEQQVHALSEFITNGEDLPISATSIRGRLQRME